MRFKKGELSSEAYRVIMYDLGCLRLIDDEDNKYHYELLKGNIKDVFGRKR